MYIKYPRTYHFPFSPGATSDDKILSTMDDLYGREVVVTEKMDGECTTIHSSGYTHARSIDSRSHESRDWVKRFANQIAHNIPPGWRICGENLYAQHSLPYDDLLSYFYGFSIWDDHNDCLNWYDTVYLFEELGITTVPVLYRGPFIEKKIIQLTEDLDLTKQEGLVVRITNTFNMADFSTVVAKWVRREHVQTDDHWMNQPVIPNKLRQKK